MFRLFFCACLLIVLVKTNPVPQNCPGPCYDQITYRNSLDDFSYTIIPSFISPLNQITEYEKNNKIDRIYKLFNDRLANNPAALNFVKNVGGFNNEDILNYIRNSGNIPNIVNNYIFLPSDVNTENVLKPNNVYLESINKNKSRYDRKKKNTSKQIFNIPCIYTDDIKHEGTMQTSNMEKNFRKKESTVEKTIESNINNEDDIRKTLKRSLEEESNITNRDNSNLKLKTNSPDDIHNDKMINMEQKSSTKTRRKDKSKQSPDRSLSKINKKENNTENTLPNRKDSATHDSGLNHKSNKKRTVRKMKNNEPDQKKHAKERNLSKDGNKDIIQQKGKKNVDHKNKNIQNDNPSIPNDFNDMYKYIDTLLSNYQFTNTNFNSGFPFDYNNFYQLSQPTAPWNSINTINDKIMPHKHRKLQRLGKRLHKKRSKLKKHRGEQHKGKTVDDQKLNFNSDSDLNKDITKPGKREESMSLTDEVLKNTDMISLGPDINSTKLLEDSTSNNNSFTEESSNYNSYPTLIIGMEDTVPIIFEDSFIDDYYPDFTADNKALIMTPEENHAKMYTSDKYRYVSNHNLDLEDYVKKRKELAKHNINTNTKLFFSEKATNGDAINSGEDVIDNTEGRIIKFQSPPLLDNPDFRTRKIESHEKYEPYYYHNVFHDPDEDFNKYYSEKKEIVYPISYSFKNDFKNKLCNEIDDSSAKAKWKKIKDSNVETVYANSKLAKYGLVL